jgi:hypothetical protein
MKKEHSKPAHHSGGGPTSADRKREGRNLSRANYQKKHGGHRNG